MHVAKAIWGMLEAKNEIAGLKNLDQKVKFVAKAYAHGAQKFEESETAKREITEINKKVYSKDPEITRYWKLGREWSLKHFEKIYKMLGVAYDFYYFESKTAPEGKKLVEKFTKSGVFEKDAGAIILRAEKSGLHTRVFVSSEGNPTYEAKDLALALMKFKDFPYDKSYIITANEQIDYFKVVLKALSFVAPDVAVRNFHFSFGFVSLKDGKMSSRLGNVIPGEWLIEETAKHLKEKFPKVDPETLGKIAVGAVKYSMLRFGRESDIKFSFEDSINLHGNSAPYLQYTFARANSILEKSGKKGPKKFSQDKLATEMLAVTRLVCQFETAVFYAAENFSPNILCNYLYSLATKFNLFYEEHKVVGAPDEYQKLALVAAVSKTLEKGLYLLGIEAPEKI
jgi:arginyl-tRNA synthetase